MTVDEIYSKLATHMKLGIQYHNEFAQAYDFLGLWGFSQCQFYHQIEEELNFRCLQHYYAKHWFRLIKIEDTPPIEIIPASWYKYNTHAVDTGTKRNSIKELMTKWINWEKETKTLYQSMRLELYTLGEVAAALDLDKYIMDVDKELRHAEKRLLELETIGYDIVKIMESQEELYKKYKKKLGW